MTPNVRPLPALLVIVVLWVLVTLGALALGGCARLLGLDVDCGVGHCATSRGTCYACPEVWDAGADGR